MSSIRHPNQQTQLIQPAQLIRFSQFIILIVVMTQIS